MEAVCLSDTCRTPAKKKSEEVLHLHCFRGCEFSTHLQVVYGAFMLHVTTRSFDEQKYTLVAPVSTKTSVGVSCFFCMFFLFVLEGDKRVKGL